MIYLAPVFVVTSRRLPAKEAAALFRESRTCKECKCLRTEEELIFRFCNNCSAIYKKQFDRALAENAPTSQASAVADSATQPKCKKYCTLLFLYYFMTTIIVILPL
jgi:hypothetical protein